MRTFFLFLLPACTLLAKETTQRVFFAYETYYRDYHEKFEAPLKSDEKGVLSGLRVGYDYDHRLYLGADLGIAWGRTRYDGSTVSLLTGEIAPSEATTDNQIFNIEARGGRTFRYRRCAITPFLGVGFFQWNRLLDEDREDYYWHYGAVGFRSVCECTSFFSIGLNLKAMRMLRGEISIDTNDHFFHQILRLGNRWQGLAELPLTYRIDRHWDVRWVPFFLKQNIGRSNSALSIDPDFGTFRILEPSSRTYVIGLRVESGFNF